MAIAMKDGSPFGPGRPGGELEGADFRRVASHVRDHNDRCQRDGGRDSRPDAAHSRAAGLYALAQ